MSARIAPATAAPARIVDLVTHDSVEIPAESAVIGPFLLDTDSWKQGAKPVRESGEPNAAGEVRVARGVVDGVEYMLTVDAEVPVR
ncbi:hypothetical protein [Prauserella flavalba]|uniref:Uncharacterized protein n=1 Tax=Prauserella flavalba TaxID=1477506 RepID=A0A318LJ09_9PSEU|nr:hypothetical protein [Prauserella flavalba]PXY26372.1 hypothetical protein BA062_24840 [Prauserella flavalba]